MQHYGISSGVILIRTSRNSKASLAKLAKYAKGSYKHSAFLCDLRVSARK
jgi:hypothetical protein